MSVPYQYHGTTGFNFCPWTGFKGAYSTGSTTTSNLPFPGGWKPNDPTINPYGGIYGFVLYNDPTIGNAYALDVVPNYANNTWIGTAPSCSVGPSNCNNYGAPNIPYNLMPKLWTGYSTNTDGIKIPSTGCTQCTTGEQVLCTTDNQMSIDSCPGATGTYAFSTPPFMEARTDYYSNVSPIQYPRGKGRCVYPANIIKNDQDLSNLMQLSNYKQIDPDLAILLGLNYCYSTVNGPCGVSPAGLIMHCTKYMVDKQSSNSSQLPCVQLIDGTLMNSPSGKNLLNMKNQEWCNDVNNMYTPLCDCINADINNQSNPVQVRSVYATISDALIPNVGNTIPKECWFKPCNTYAFPHYSNIQCPTTLINCNNIISSNSPGFIGSNSQYLSCNTNTTTPQPSTTPISTPVKSTFSNIITNPSVFWPVFIIFVIIVVIIITLLKPKNNNVNPVSPTVNK